MKTTILLGLQYGSESKGMVASSLAKAGGYDAAITVNSCQAGHTSYAMGLDGPVKIVNRQLPSAFPYVDKVIIGAGAMIKPHVLKEEIEFIEKNGWKDIRKKLYIDKHAGIVPDDAGEHEKELVKEIGSTGEGVGWALQERIMRRAPVVKDDPFFKDYGEICDTWKLYHAIDTAILEGCQGFGLSLYYGYYPKTTSRDTGVLALASGAGIPPASIDQVVGVARTYPIRVGTVVKSSGYMFEEVDWETVTKESGSPEPLVEKTTVTGRVRRVARWDDALIEKAVYMNSVDKIALTFINYVNWGDAEVDNWHDLSEKSKDFIHHNVARHCKVGWVSGNPYGMFPVTLSDLAEAQGSA